MEIREWRAKNNSRRNYAHFDCRISLNDVWSYINKPDNIAKHSFYPFIHYTQTFNKYNKTKGIKEKKREICYSAHIDRCIFQYYAYKLNQIYNNRVQIDGLNYVAIAYRDNLRKNNIHFAKETIDFIRKTLNCYIIVGDFTNFFDRLSHEYLKQRLKDLLQKDKLPSDYYSVYKNITKYSIWELKSLLEINNLPVNKNGIKTLNELDKVLPLEDFKTYKKGNIKQHKEDYGIPQGSAISAILSNIYMLDFDKQINEYVILNKGLYRRYSDDFIIIFPNVDAPRFIEHYNFFKECINSVRNLDLQPDKTKLYYFDGCNIRNCNRIALKEVDNDQDSLNYLGFTFDGKIVTIRDKTISKYYYRLYRKLKTIIKNHGKTKNGHKISFEKVYIKYSIKGANGNKKLKEKRKRNGNFLTYVKRAEKIFGKGEAISRGTKNHLNKIRRKLKTINS